MESDLSLEKTVSASSVGLAPAIEHRAGSLRALTQIRRPKAERIHILREVVAETETPVMLCCVGNDCACTMHQAKKASFPARPPFPLLHVDTTWKFRDMYALRDQTAAQAGGVCWCITTPKPPRVSINPVQHSSHVDSDRGKTQGLQQTLDEYAAGTALRGACRDEEKSRANERFSVPHPDPSLGSQPVASGVIRRGQRVRVQPSGRESIVAPVVTADRDLERAIVHQAITLRLAHQIDVSRGDVISPADAPARRPRRPTSTWLRCCR